MTAGPAKSAGPFDKLNHIIVIYEENWSFDGLYGSSPGRVATPVPGRR